MHRRRYLAASLGLPVAFTGTTGANQETTDEGEDQEERACPPERENDGTSSGDGEPEIEIRDHEPVVDDSGFTTDVYVDTTVENVGDAPSGQIDLQADWYDEDGNYLDNGQTWLRTLRPGETWLARVPYLGTSEEAVADYELAYEVEPEPPTAPDNLVLEESEMRVGETEVVIDGRITNDTGSEQSYVEAIAIIYDEECRVLGSEWTTVTGVADGDTWSFEMTWLELDRVNEAATHRVVVSDGGW